MTQFPRADDGALSQLTNPITWVSLALCRTAPEAKAGREKKKQEEQGRLGLTLHHQQGLTAYSQHILLLVLQSVVLRRQHQLGDPPTSSLEMQNLGLHLRSIKSEMNDKWVHFIQGNEVAI